MRVNEESYLFEIINDKSIDKPKHFLIIYDSGEKIVGFKQEQAFLQSLASYLRKKQELVTIKSSKKLTEKDLKDTISTIGNEVQLIVLFSGHGKANLLQISSIGKVISFDISQFPNDTVMFTSSCKPFMRKEKRRSITVVGESKGIIYPHRPGGLYGVYEHLNKTPGSIKDDELCFSVKTY